MAMTWTKIKLWTKVTIFGAVAIYLIAFVLVNRNATINPALDFVFHTTATPNALLVLLLTALFSIFGWWLFKTVFKTLRQMREVRSGGSYLSQNDLRAHFGLGDHAGPVDVEVRLGPAVWRWKGLPVDRYTTLRLREQDRVRPLSSLYFKRQHCVHDRRPAVHVEDLPGNEARFIHA